MAIDTRALRDRRFPVVDCSLSARDAALHALSLGLGVNPVDAQTRPLVLQDAIGGARVLPTQLATLGHPGPWMRDPGSGIDGRQVVLAEFRLQVHHLPGLGAPLRAHNRITHVWDLGPARGARVVVERRIHEPQGRLMACMQQVLACLGDGGFSQTQPGAAVDDPLDELPVAPTGAPDVRDLRPTRPDSALLFRLLGDLNPIHVDAQAALAAGFARPILHGVATLGLACWSVLQACAQGDPRRLRSLAARFAAPVHPGEGLEIWLWPQRDRVRFEARVQGRDLPVLRRGVAELAPLD
ncbi:MAG: 3-alpha,7-alpha,12-alpha-trihydroxy-5-beta-cholest-24-enoyl-CoA hydratase [Rhodoferax sp.]|nr:3-alpha,7-alpha,12-alpha-trihydroxy-5-beta-cholest-24-enoyl-CoA hydratase [Rhodoferax sp.]